MAQLGLLGLGRMGAAMRDRIRAAGHEVVGYDHDASLSDTSSLAELVSWLTAPRMVWLMVPPGEPTRNSITELADLLDEGDLVLEGGNSPYQQDRVHADLLAECGIGYLDVGVSGGIWGESEGYALMIGGSADNVARAMPIIDALRPDGPREESVVHAGGVGAGHFVKMVHNGIEYGLMQAYAEGFELLASSDEVTDIAGVLTAWSRGTVIRSWLLDLLAGAVSREPGLESVHGWVDDTGEGRWTVAEAIDRAVPAPVITAALYTRFGSRQEDSPAMKAVAALRNEFGGHEVSKVADHVSTPPPAD